MSDHDPFDGIYSRSMIPKSETDKPEDHAPEDKSDTVVTVYSAPYLRRQSKAELQDICKARGLDASGGRDDMIERIEDDQKS